MARIHGVPGHYAKSRAMILFDRFAGLLLAVMAVYGFLVGYGAGTLGGLGLLIGSVVSLGVLWSAIRLLHVGAAGAA